MAKTKRKEPRDQIVNIRTTAKVKATFDDKARQLGIKNTRLFDQMVMDKPVFQVSSSGQIAALLFNIHTDIGNLPDHCDKQALHNAISALVDVIAEEKENLLREWG